MVFKGTCKRQTKFWSPKFSLNFIAITMNDFQQCSLLAPGNRTTSLKTSFKPVFYSSKKSSTTCSLRFIIPLVTIPIFITTLSNHSSIALFCLLFSSFSLLSHHILHFYWLLFVVTKIYGRHYSFSYGVQVCLACETQMAIQDVQLVTLYIMSYTPYTNCFSMFSSLLPSMPQSSVIFGT